MCSSHRNCRSCRAKTNLAVPESALRFPREMSYGTTEMIGEKRVARFRVLFFIYVTVSLLLFAAAARGGATPQETTAAATSTDATTSQEPERRALPAALDGVFPGSDYLGPTPLIGVPDTDPIWPLTKALWDAYPALKRARIKVYGWINPGISVSTSNRSNIPE